MLVIPVNYICLFFCFLLQEFFSSYILLCHHLLFQDDEGDNAFHIAADAAKMIRENLEWLIVMLSNPEAAVEVRNHRQVVLSCLLVCYLFSGDSCCSYFISMCSTLALFVPFL